MEIRSKILHIFLLFILVIASLNNLYDLLSDNFPPKMNDLKPIYVAVRLFFQGENPYEDSSIKKEWQSVKTSEKLTDDQEPGLPMLPFIHPPATLLVLSPFALTNWQIAKHLYFIFNLIITLSSLLLIARLGNMFDHKKEIWLLVLSFFSVKACILGLLFGQFFYFSFFFCLLTVNFVLRKKTFLSSIFMALGLLKPTIGIAFILYILVKKRYDIFIYSILIFMVLNLVVFATLPPTAFESYLDITMRSLGPGGVNDYSTQNIRFYDLTSAPTIIYLLTGSRLVVTIITIVISLFMLILLVQKRNIYLKDSFYTLFIFTLCSLLLIYHRAYDSLMLLTIFLWQKPTELINNVKWKIIFLLPLLLPITGLILSIKPYIPETIYYILVLNIPISLSAFLIVILLHPVHSRFLSK